MVILLFTAFFLYILLPSRHPKTHARTTHTWLALQTNRANKQTKAKTNREKCKDRQSKKNWQPAEVEVEVERVMFWPKRTTERAKRSHVKNEANNKNSFA